MERNCPQCNKTIEYKHKSSLDRATKKNRLCKECTNKILQIKSSESSTILWQNPMYREKRIKLAKNPEYREKISLGLKKICQNPDHKEKMQKNAKKVWENEEYREKQSKISKEMWKNEEYREKQIISHIKFWENEEYREKQSKISKEMWKNEEYREKQKEINEERWENPEIKQKLILSSKKVWENPEYRERQKLIRQDPEYRKRSAIARSKQSRKVSSIQIILYSILDDLGIPYHREWENKQNDSECRKGPWNFDCVVPRKGKATLLIECQGNYWHSLPKGIRNDKAKATYVAEYHPECEIKYIWEHEFLNYNKVVELIKYWIGITQLELIEYKFSDLIIKKPKAEEYKLLLSKYHYLPNAGRGGIVYGCYLEDELIGIVVFSAPVRQNIDIGKKFLELSRFCVHPKYQKKNLGSWFISRTIKLLKEERPDIGAILSYSDTTFNHDGALYKSLNFIQDRTVRPDYWYVDERGWVMHKKTLYDHAVKMKMKESEFAEKHNYKKVYGKEKLRFVLEI